LLAGLSGFALLRFMNRSLTFVLDKCVGL